MPEPLTTGLVVEQMQKLLVAFPRNLGAKDPARMAEVYRNGLSGLSGDALRAAVNRCVQEDQYFPKVARLRELGTEWTRRNVVSILPLSRTESERHCHVCGAVPENIEITRQRRELRKDATGRERWELVLDEKGKPITEKVMSTSTYMTHDRRAHGVFSHSSDEAMA